MGILILSVLAAFGVLCVLWTFLGFLLPGQKGTFMVYPCRGENLDALIRRYRWLRDLGLIRCPLLLVDQGMTEQQREALEGKYGIEICRPEQLPDRLG